MKKLSIFVFVLFLIWSCTNSGQRTSFQNEEEKEETPVVLEKQNSSYELQSRSKWYGADIIAQLYEEALEKDENLKALDDSIQNIRAVHSDSLKSYYNYVQTNANYKKTVDQYVDRLQDSVVKAETRNAFRIIEEKHRIAMQAYVLKINDIEQQVIKLNDQYLILRLEVAQSMMNIYRKNEKPSLRLLEAVGDEYDILRAKIEKFVKK